MNREEIIRSVRDTLIEAGSVFSEDKMVCYKNSMDRETNPLAKWTIGTIIDNAGAAQAAHSPLCDDTGIPHLILEIGKNRSVSGDFLEAVYLGVKEGLTDLPGRPMAIQGNDIQRIDQSGGLNPESAAVIPAPLALKYVPDENRLRLTILMQGGGPEIRAKTYRVFHKHDMRIVMDEIISWASDAIKKLGCSPCTIAVGIGRSHYEASALMLQAMAEGQYSRQSEYEQYITDTLNQSNVGALGLGGSVSVLGTFMKIGPQRASGVRIVCMRPCCCFEPRKASVDL